MVLDGGGRWDLLISITAFVRSHDGATPIAFDFITCVESWTKYFAMAFASCGCAGIHELYVGAARAAIGAIEANASIEKRMSNVL